MRYKKAYIDIEATYQGSINPDKSDLDKQKFFRDFPNWVFYHEYEHEGRTVAYKGIIGLYLLTLDIDEKTNDHKIIDKKFVQLIGKSCTSENLKKYLEGVNEVLSYHGRSKPNQKGYIGYDFGVINAQLSIMLDDLPGVKSTDLEIICHRAGVYGGLKRTEEVIPGIPSRKSGISDGLEEEKLLKEIACCTDKEERLKMWKKAKLYNREDCTMLIYIEQIMKNIRYCQDEG